MMLEKINNQQSQTIDSREVSKMLGKEHKVLMREIKGGGNVKGIIPILTRENFSPVEYFVEDTYIDKKGETRACFLVTKMGCEMLGARLQGEKGILFQCKIC